MAADYSSKELIVDIFFGGLGKTGKKISSIAQQGLLDSFKSAAKLNDLATRLAIPIQLLTVTGAKVVAARGYL